MLDRFLPTVGLALPVSVAQAQDPLGTLDVLNVPDGSTYPDMSGSGSEDESGVVQAEGFEWALLQRSAQGVVNCLRGLERGVGG